MWLANFITLNRLSIGVCLEQSKNEDIAYRKSE